MELDITRRRRHGFVLWLPAHTATPPRLVIGRFDPGNPPRFLEHGSFELLRSPDHDDLWEIGLDRCDLADNTCYHYWFQVEDSRPGAERRSILVTDPFAEAVDWRLLAPAPAGGTDADRDPAAVCRIDGGRIVPVDCAAVSGWPGVAGGEAVLETLPANNRLVLYELPTTWCRGEGLETGVSLATGTFADVLALVEEGAAPVHFDGVSALAPGVAHLQALGVNGLELLPVADSFVDREWGYATSNYNAPDFDLGFPRYYSWPAANHDLGLLVTACHRQGIRFFIDVVMAFATHGVWENVNYDGFHVAAGSDDPEAWDLGRPRQGFGGELFRYSSQRLAYDPVDGGRHRLVPARRFMAAVAQRWIDDFQVDGIRLDSVENLASWDFVAEYTAFARRCWRQRWQDQPAETVESRFLVVGEELRVPVALVHQGRLDALWNERFKELVRCAILGETRAGYPDFAAMVMDTLDCRRLGFTDLAQAVNYLTSHDVEGFRNERLYDFCRNNGVTDIPRRLRLAFVCLLTAVGIPMILAGEEFGDQHDLPVRHPEKQVDPVNYDRLAHPWRRELFDYVARLVRLRCQEDALAVNDIHWLHVDLTPGRRVLVWRRGGAGASRPVVVVANFSPWSTPDPHRPEAEYRIPAWPRLAGDPDWWEVTQERRVPAAWAGREPLYPWEAKVYVPLA